AFGLPFSFPGRALVSSPAVGEESSRADGPPPASGEAGMVEVVFNGGTVVLKDRLLEGGQVEVSGGDICAVRAAPAGVEAREVVDLGDRYLVPGFIDLHVHGGAGADFMDGTEEAFRTVCRAHARHGTTSLLPTTTVARHQQHMAFLNVCRKRKAGDTGGARILGAHFYGPYF